MQCLFHAILAANLEKEKLKKRTSDALCRVQPCTEPKTACHWRVEGMKKLL